MWSTLKEEQGAVHTGKMAHEAGNCDVLESWPKAEFCGDQLFWASDQLQSRYCNALCAYLRVLYLMGTLAQVHITAACTDDN